VTSADFDFLGARFALDVAAPVILAVTPILDFDHSAPVATPTTH